MRMCSGSPGGRSGCCSSIPPAAWILVLRLAPAMRSRNSAFSFLTNSICAWPDLPARSLSEMVIATSQFGPPTGTVQAMPTAAPGAPVKIPAPASRWGSPWRMSRYCRSVTEVNERIAASRPSRLLAPAQQLARVERGIAHHQRMRRAGGVAEDERRCRAQRIGAPGRGQLLARRGPVAAPQPAHPGRLPGQHRELPLQPFDRGAAEARRELGGQRRQVLGVAGLELAPGLAPGRAEHWVSLARASW